MYWSKQAKYDIFLILEEAPYLYIEAYNVTTSTAVIRWQPLKRTESVVDFTGYRVSLKSEKISRVTLVNTNVSSLRFDDLHAFTNYCVTVEPLTILASTWREDCHDFVTEDDGEILIYFCCLVNILLLRFHIKNASSVPLYTGYLIKQTFSPWH